MIDHTKRAALSHYLLDNVTSTIPGDKLDEKLASLTLFSDASDRESAVLVDWPQMSLMYRFLRQYLHRVQMMQHGGMHLVR